MSEDPTAPAVAGPPVDTDVRPGRTEVVVALIAAIVLYGGGITLLVAVPAPTPVLEGLAQLAFSGLAPLGVFAVVVLIRIRDLRVFGVRRVDPKWLLVGVAFGLGCLAVVLTFDGIVASFFPGADDTQDKMRASAGGGLATLIGTIALGGLLTPLGEELLFRGVLTRFLQRWGTWITVLVSAFVFALWHGINLVFPAAFVVGLCCAWLVCRTRSVWPGVVVHVVYNSAFLLIYAFG